MRYLSKLFPRFFVTDPLSADDPPPNPQGGGGAAIPRREPGYVSCEFCKCKLTRTGEIVNVSDDARAYRDEHERFEKFKSATAEREAELTKQIEELRNKVAALTDAPQSTRRTGTALGV